MFLQSFTQPVVLKAIGQTRLALLLRPFADDLLARNLPLPTPDPPDDNYFNALAALFARPADLPDRLRSGLLAIEHLAAPGNLCRLDDAIACHIPNISIPRDFLPVDRALELWLHYPDKLLAFLPSPVQGSTFEVQCSTLPSPPPIPAAEPATCNPQPATPAVAADTLAFSLQPSAFSDDSAAFARLARLTVAEYDRCRRPEAKALGIRIETLDAEVAKVRLELEAKAVNLPAIIPWPEPVNGAELLDQVQARFTLYLVLPPGAATAFTLWTAHTHAHAAFRLSPRLNLSAPQPGCGKTACLDVLATLVPRPVRTENLRTAVLFRLVDQFHPTLLLDEVDTYIDADDELRGLLNAGHKRGACAHRCEGKHYSIRPFQAFAPAALAGIGSLPGTLLDRSVIVHLRKAEPGEIMLRFDEEHLETETDLARKLARWAQDNFAALQACDPPLPQTAYNRLADNWRPLFAIAQIAGADWPTRALEAFNCLSASPFKSQISNLKSTPPDQSAAPSSEDSPLKSQISNLKDGSPFKSQISNLKSTPPNPSPAPSSEDSPFKSQISNLKFTPPDQSAAPHSAVTLQPSDTSAFSLQPSAFSLLAAIRSVFAQSGAQRLFSCQIVAALRALHSPIPDSDAARTAVQRSKLEVGSSTFDVPDSKSAIPHSARNTPHSQGFALTERELARQLRPLGIRPKHLRIAHAHAKGYELADFSPAFDRFLPRPSP